MKSKDSFTTKELLTEMAMLDVVGYSKQDESFYSSTEWINLRSEYKKENPFCETCLEEGKKKVVDEVHHIKPIRQGGEPLDKNNLISLCKGCHGEIHSTIGVRIDNLLEMFDSLRTYTMEVVYVDKINSDGTSRQEVISKCKEGESLRLVDDPLLGGKPSSPETGNTIKVFRKSGEQVGFLDRKEARLRLLNYYLYHDREITVKVKNITETAGKYGCVIELKLGDYKYEAPWSYTIKDRQWESKIYRKAKSNESSDPDEAVRLYRKIMNFCKKFDDLCEKNDVKTWRTSRYPINRLTLILEKGKKYRECLDEIVRYELLKDEVGLTKTDGESLRKRKIRIIKKLS